MQVTDQLLAIGNVTSTCSYYHSSECSILMGLFTGQLSLKTIYCTLSFNALYGAEMGH